MAFTPVSFGWRRAQGCACGPPTRGSPRFPQSALALLHSSVCDLCGAGLSACLAAPCGGGIPPSPLPANYPKLLPANYPKLLAVLIILSGGHCGWHVQHYLCFTCQGKVLGAVLLPVQLPPGRATHWPLDVSLASSYLSSYPCCSTHGSLPLRWSSALLSPMVSLLLPPTMI